MNCYQCDHEMQDVRGVPWCVRCGTIWTGTAYESPWIVKRAHQVLMTRPYSADRRTAYRDLECCFRWDRSTDK